MTTTRGDIRTDEVGRGRRTEKKGVGGISTTEGSFRRYSHTHITKNPACIRGGVKITKKSNYIFLLSIIPKLYPSVPVTTISSG